MVNPATNRIYVVNSDSTSKYVTVIDSTTNTMLGVPPPVGTAPIGIVVNPVTNRLYVANSGDASKSVSVIGVPLTVGPGTLPTGGTVSVAWSGLYLPNGADFVGLYDAGAASTSPLSRLFTNGTRSPTGTGVDVGKLSPPIPANLQAGDHEIRLVSGATGGTFALTRVDLPTAANDSYLVITGNALTLPAPGVLADDTDPDSPSLQATIVTGPAHGALALKPDGSFGYTPSGDFFGIDTFTYRASDCSSQSAPTAVTIAVTPTECAPRPRVQAAPAPAGRKLQAHVESTPLNTQQTNPLKQLKFGTFQNAKVTLNGQTIASGQTVAVPAAATTINFAVERATPGQATTVPFTVVDGCGEWPTFVGGGTAAGF